MTVAPYDPDQVYASDTIHVPRGCNGTWEIEGRDYQQKIDWKPKGLWWSAGLSWIEWAEDERFSVGGPVYRLTLDRSDLLMITTAEELDRFDMEYGRDRANPLHGPAKRHDKVDWALVAERWSGIEIAPYIGERRFDGPARWYYVWDCASGCTWRPTDIVERVEYLGFWADEEATA
jgi:hypothetical protein